MTRSQPQRGSACGKSTIDHECCTGHIAGLVGSQQERAIGDIAGLSGFAKGNRRQELFNELRSEFFGGARSLGVSMIPG